MPTAKVTSKGQITVPASVRRELGVKSGDLLAFEVKAGYVTVRRQDSLEEASAKIRELTRGSAPAYSDDDEAILSAFDDVADAERGGDLVLIRLSDEDLA
jgi:antitoxin PrlF